MRAIAILTLVLAAGVAGVVRSLPDDDVATAPTPATQEVQSISIDEDGGRGLPLAQLREVISTKIGAIVDPARLERDRIALQQWLSARGYLAAKVAMPIVTFGAAGGALIVFDIQRGPLFHVDDVRLEGKGWKDAGVVTIASGDEALGDRLARARQAAEDTLARHGQELRVELVLEPDPRTAMVDVAFVTR
ncbi:MAG: POTRA domain-containing protein [Kofleriaceae bacterium]